MLNYSALILLVDDEPSMIDMLQRVGQHHFSEATFINTNSTQQTLAYFTDTARPRPQLILLDIDLHEPTNGFDLLAQIQQHPHAKGIPIVMFSVSVSDSDISRAYQVGAVAYTRKPDTLADWTNYVKTLREYWFDTAILPRTSLP